MPGHHAYGGDAAFFTPPLFSWPLPEASGGLEEAVCRTTTFQRPSEAPGGTLKYISNFWVKTRSDILRPLKGLLKAGSDV